MASLSSVMASLMSPAEERLPSAMARTCCIVATIFSLSEDWLGGHLEDLVDHLDHPLGRGGDHRRAGLLLDHGLAHVLRHLAHRLDGAA